MGHGQSKLQNNLDDALIQFSKVVDCIKSVTSGVTKSAKEIFGYEKMKEAFETLIHTHWELNKEEKEAVQQLQNCIEKVIIFKGFY